MNTLTSFFSRCRMRAAAYAAAFALSVPAALCLLGTSLVHSQAHADAGHDHGEAAAAPAGERSPRVIADSDLFEIVGIVEAGAMTIYLDRHDTNQPVIGAKIDVEAGVAKGTATSQSDGTYRFENAVLAGEETLAVSFTVTAGNDTDLLAGDLVLEHAHEHAGGDSAHRPWLQYGAYAGGAFLLAAVVLIAMRRSRRNASAHTTGAQA